MENIIAEGFIVLDGSIESARKAVLYSDNPEKMAECLPEELYETFVEVLSQMAREKSEEDGLHQNYRFTVCFTEQQVYLGMKPEGELAS